MERGQQFLAQHGFNSQEQQEAATKVLHEQIHDRASTLKMLEASHKEQTNDGFHHSALGADGLDCPTCDQHHAELMHIYTLMDDYKKTTGKDMTTHMGNCAECGVRL